MVKTEFGSHIGVTVRIYPIDTVHRRDEPHFRDIEDVKGFGPLGEPVERATHAYVSPEVLMDTIGSEYTIDVPGVRQIPAEETWDQRPEVEIPLLNNQQAHITRFSS